MKDFDFHDSFVYNVEDDHSAFGFQFDVSMIGAVGLDRFRGSVEAGAEVVVAWTSLDDFETCDLGRKVGLSGRYEKSSQFLREDW